MASRMTFEQATSKFVNRYTMDYIPPWALVAAPNGKFYAPHFRSDREWYDNTTFPPENGKRKYCTTNNQTFPLGNWLNEPYSGKSSA